MAQQPTNLNQPDPSAMVLDAKTGQWSAAAATWFRAIAGVLGAWTCQALTAASAAITGALTAATAVFSISMTAPVGGILGSNALLHVRDEETAGTNAGTFTTGAWRTRVLNTVKTNEITGASLAANQIVLPAGTYWIEAQAPAMKVDRHKCKLRNVTDGTDAIVGSSEFSAAAIADGVSTNSLLAGRLTIAAAKTFELQHQCQTTFATFGLGIACNFAVVEVYAEVRLWKLA